MVRVRYLFSKSPFSKGWLPFCRLSLALLRSGSISNDMKYCWMKCFEVRIGSLSWKMILASLRPISFTANVNRYFIPTRSCAFLSFLHYCSPSASTSKRWSCFWNPSKMHTEVRSSKETLSLSTTSFEGGPSDPLSLSSTFLAIFLWTLERLSRALMYRPFNTKASLQSLNTESHSLYKKVIDHVTLLSKITYSIPYFFSSSAIKKIKVMKTQTQEFFRKLKKLEKCTLLQK